jgi:hypothetical protein
MPFAAPVIARQSLIILRLVACWDARHDARAWLMIGCTGNCWRGQTKAPADSGLTGAKEIGHDFGRGVVATTLRLTSLMIGKSLHRRDKAASGPSTIKSPEVRALSPGPGSCRGGEGRWGRPRPSSKDILAQGSPIAL